MLRKLAAAAAALGLAALPGAALADDFYRVNAGDTVTITLYDVCSAHRVVVNGDGDTDLDFLVQDANGNIVHTDADYTDITFFNVYPRNGRCTTYNITVINHGSVYNRFYVGYRD